MLGALGLSDLVLQPRELLLGLVGLGFVVELDGELGEPCVVVLCLVVELTEGGAHPPHLVRVEPCERLGVDTAALLLEHDLGDLLPERRLTLALVGQRLLRLGAPAGACHRVPIHAPRIMRRVTALSRRAPGAVLAGASAAQAAVALVNFGLPAIGPQLRDDFDLSLFELGAVLSAGLFGAGVALIGAGILVDRIGARRAMLAGTALGAFGLALAASAGSKYAFFSAMFVFGLGSAIVPIAGTGALLRAYPAARRGWAMGVRQTAVPLGGAIAAIVYPSLYALGGTRLTLGVSAVAVVVTGCWFALTVTAEPPVRRPMGRGSFGAILRAPGFPLLLAVAACYIVVLQALLAYLVPAAREAGQSELTASVAYLSMNVSAMVARIGWGRSPTVTTACDAFARSSRWVSSRRSVRWSSAPRSTPVRSPWCSRPSSSASERSGGTRWST